MMRTGKLINFLILIFILSFVSCGGDDDNAPIDGDSDSDDLVEMDGDLEESSEQDADPEVVEEQTDGDMDEEIEIAEEDGEHPPYEDAQALMVKGPYIQKVTETEVNIAWESSLFSSARLELWLEDEEPDTYSGKSWKIEGDIWLDMPKAPTPDGWQNIVKVEGLEQGTVYNYRIVSLEEPSEDFHFSTPEKGHYFKLVAYGDSRSNHDIHSLVTEAIAAEDPDIVLHSGDFVERGWYLDHWQAFFDSISTFDSSVPFVGSFGNHEAGGMSLFAGYFSSFFEVTDDRPVGSTAYRWGDVFVVSINTERIQDPGSKENDWMREQFDSVKDDDSVSYRFLIFHKPYYTWSGHKWDERFDAESKEAMHQYCIEARINAVITGHNHLYEHFERDGITYLTLGGGGAGLNAPEQNVVEEERQFYIRSDKVHHYATFEPDNGAMNVRVIEVPGGALIEDFEMEAR